MTEEEQRAIERLEDFEDSSLFSINMQEDFRTISRLIQNQQYTIDDYREIMKNKNKQIDLMLGHIDPFRLPIEEKTTECAREYFEKQAKEV